METDERPSRDRYRTRTTYRRSEHHRSRERENRMRDKHRDRRNRSRSSKRDRFRSREGRYKTNDRGRSRDRQHRDSQKDEAVKTERKKPQSKQSGGNRGGNKPKRCFICNSDKHLAFKCPDKKDFRVRLVHERATSLSPLRKSLKQVEVEGRRLDALLDSGSDISLLQENVAKNDQEKNVDSGS
ncbi:probable splicing factor, arginine/serine-rich 7 [Lutzomyia longipalpis]|uniref:probable splicing factor, arginine/serine-rich 7 n=1 Tax=Lutzomyia longipalpis TaxID=7200 RepID=UPI0024843EC2|nr:probable splicing factor, arginine/serine-rich 7 [Lutzomyia longipalpis]